MATIKTIREFVPDDIELMVFNPSSREAAKAVGIKALKEVYGQGPAYTALVDGQPVCIAGVTPLWSGVGEAWALMAHGFEKYKLFVHRAVTYILNDIIINNDLKRVQASADCANDKAIRWLEHLGFENEGVMRKYYRDMDYFRFARVM